MSVTAAVTAALLAACLIASGASADGHTGGTYTFDKDGASTVSFGGQTARLKMADELYDGMNSNESTDATLLQQFNEGTGFADPALDESGKNIGSKVASGCLNEENAAAKEALVSMINDYANNVIPAWSQKSDVGSPGVLSDDKRTINVNSKGWEVDQTFQKALIGSFVLDQIANNYLDACKLDAGSNTDDNTNGVTIEGKPYTGMEHAWDEAFGYLYGQEEDPTGDLSTPSGSGTLMNKYLKKVSAGDVAPGIADQVFDAFVAGRKAIVDGDYATRDAQAKIIKENLSKVIGAMVVNYLEAYQAKKADTDDIADGIHALSEGYGFVFSLPFTNDGTGKPYFTQEETDEILKKMDNFWQIQDADVSSVVDQVNERFGFGGSENPAAGVPDADAPAADAPAADAPAEEEAPKSSDDG